jgi:putative endonuclease
MNTLLRLTDWLRHKARLRCGNKEHALGSRGEDLAHRLLRQKGLTVVARNYRTRTGNAEVDLVAREGDTVVFIEVKTRSTDEFGPPSDAVDAEKRRRIMRGAADYLRHAELTWDQARFDVISVVLGDLVSIEHERDAFTRTAQL